MSRGLGKWERLILAEVEKTGFAWVGAVADSVAPTLAAKQAAGRAAQTLEQKRLIVTGAYLRGRIGNYKLLACPPGTNMDFMPAWVERAKPTARAMLVVNPVV
jgi:hypothetical protein